jgi:hypothetical protein
MVTHQGCPQTPGGRIRALGFARMGTRSRRRGPRTGDVSVSGLAGIRTVAGIATNLYGREPTRRCVKIKPQQKEIIFRCGLLYSRFCNPI